MSSTNTKRASFSQEANFYNVLSKKVDSSQSENSTKSNSKEAKANSKRLQLELHFRSNKKSQRFSILFNSCRVITIVDWLIEMKNFLTSNITDANINPKNVLQTVQASDPKEELPSQIKLNLTNTDFVLIENLASFTSQAIILRLTAFFEYNLAKIERPVESCLQSFELFSCQMNAIEETALSIIDPVTFNIYLKLKNQIPPQESSASSSVPDYYEYVLDVSTDVFRLRFSYLDFNLFVKVIESVRLQFEIGEKKKESGESIQMGNPGYLMVSTPKLSSISTLKFETFSEVGFQLFLQQKYM